MLGRSLVVTVAATSPSDGSQASWVSLILRELARSQATGFIFDVAKWTLLGALLGAVVAVFACVLFSRLRWYDVRWRFARGLRWTVFVLTVGLSAILFGLAGFWSGAIAGSERVLNKSQLGTAVFPKLGDAIADAMAWVQVRSQFSFLTNEVEVSSKLDEFRAGKWELHAAQFLQQLDDIKNEAMTNLVAKVEQSALEHAPILKGGLGEELLHQFLSGLSSLAVEKKMARELKSWGVDRVYSAILLGLQSEAGRAGHPDTVARSEISALLVREGIVPGIMKPIRSTARAQQLPLIALAILGMVVPPLCVRLARRLFGGPTQVEAAPPPVRSAVP